MSARVVICCGSGGVGKTTISASLALQYALAGAKTAVVTIDPARRLADSLSIGALSNAPRAVPLPPEAGSGRLDAMMLESKATFDELVRRHSPSDASAERVLKNRYYQFSSEKLGGSHEYMAMQKLLDLWEHGPYDVIVLDTPPTRHALDFLAAPRRMAKLFDQGVLRWMVMPATRGGWRALELGSEAIARVLRALLGQQTIEEIAEFFEAFRELWDAFRDRSVRVDRLLASNHTSFVLVSSPSSSSMQEAQFFMSELHAKGLSLKTFIVNRVVSAPATLLPTPDQLPDTTPHASREDVHADMHQAHQERCARAASHQQIVDELQQMLRGAPELTLIPEQDQDVHSLDALQALTQHLEAVSWSSETDSQSG